MVPAKTNLSETRSGFFCETHRFAVGLYEKVCYKGGHEMDDVGVLGFGIELWLRILN